MSLRRVAEAPGLHRALLRAASALVPSRRRAEWLAEWRAELWHIHHERRLFAAASDPPTEDALAFSLGAFPDALWLRRNTPREGHWLQCDSARNCWLALAAAAALVALLAVALPGPRGAMQRAAYLNSNSIVQIVPEGIIDSTTPAIPFADYSSWTHRTQRLFTGFAYFTRTAGVLQLPGRTTRPLPLAIASDNFFDLLQVPLQISRLSRSGPQRRPAVVLSQDVWRRDFAADPNVLGLPVHIHGRDAVVAGVIAEDAWAFPGHSAGVWLLEDDSTLSTLALGTPGFVFAAVNRQTAAVNPEINVSRWHMDVPVRPALEPLPSSICANAPFWYQPCRSVGDSDGFDCISLADTVERPSSVFLFMLVLALLALPATIPLSFGDAPVVSESLFAATRWRRWGFLLAKLAVLVPLVYFGALDVAYARTGSLVTAEYLQLAASFIGCLILFRWALDDQRQRCPICLRLLTNPVRVGEPSRYFLAWSGTEMICSRGHGLLHTAELPTSWAGPRRWLHLDPSWKPLFTDAFTSLPS